MRQFLIVCVLVLISLVVGGGKKQKSPNMTSFSYIIPPHLKIAKLKETTQTQKQKQQVLLQKPVSVEKKVVNLKVVNKVKPVVTNVVIKKKTPTVKIAKRTTVVPPMVTPTEPAKPVKPVKPVTPVVDEPVVVVEGKKVKCCKKCPPPKFKFVPNYIYKRFKLSVPVPVFKPVHVYDRCPEGFVQIGQDKCVRTIRTPGECPADYFRLKGDECVRIIVINKNVETKVICPPGFKKVGVSCRYGKEVSPPEYKLPEFKFDFNVPRIPEIEIPEIECPAGYRKVSKYRCVKVLRCPVGFEWDDEDEECVRSTIECPKGYVNLGRRKCIKKERECPDGFRRDTATGACIKIIIVPPLPCPKGFFELKPGLCVKKECYGVRCKVLNKCPQGYLLKKGKKDCCYKCQPCNCSNKKKIVCGTDHKTYLNECSAHCMQVAVKHVGKCEKCEGVVCRVKKCPAGWTLKKIYKKDCCPICVPPKECDKEIKPVCGVDNITYPNKCVAKKFKAKIKRDGKCFEKCTANKVCLFSKCNAKGECKVVYQTVNDKEI